MGDGDDDDLVSTLGIDDAVWESAKKCPSESPPRHRADSRVISRGFNCSIHVKEKSAP
jgi:hypothetical protein